MFIQFNANKQLDGQEGLQQTLTGLISDSLNRFNQNVTSLEVYLGDENNSKAGNADKRCTLEAHLKGTEPITVIQHAESYDYAVRGAVDKMENLLDKTIERMRNY